MLQEAEDNFMRQTPYFISWGERFTTILADLTFPLARRTARLANTKCHLILALVEA